MSHRSWILFLLCAVALAAIVCVVFDTTSQPAAAAPPPTTYECRWTDTPIVIDGKDDDAAWKHAQAIDTFGQPWEGNKAPKLRGKTRAKLLWDRDYLYFFADM